MTFTCNRRMIVSLARVFFFPLQTATSQPRVACRTNGPTCPLFNLHQRLRRLRRPSKWHDVSWRDVMHNPAKDAPPPPPASTAEVRIWQHHVRTIYTATKSALKPTGQKEGGTRHRNWVQRKGDWRVIWGCSVIWHRHSCRNDLPVVLVPERKVRFRSYRTR